MKARRFFAVVFCLSVLASLLTTTPASAADSNGCSSNTNNPHFSSGAGGVIAKATYKCTTSGVDQIYLSIILYKCPTSNVNKNKTWLKNNCVNKGDNTQNVITPTAGKVYTRTAPPASQPGAQGTGYWVLYNFWASDKNGNLSAFHHHFSNVVFLSV